MSKRKIIIAVGCLASIFFVSVCFTRSATSERLLQVAHDYKKKGRYLEALSFYKDITMNTWSKRVSPSLYRGLADIYYEYLEDSNSALALYRQIIETFPHEAYIPLVYHRLAKIFFHKGECEKSLQFYRDIRTFFPTYYRDTNIADELQQIEAGGKLTKENALSVDRTLPSNIRVLVEESTAPITVASKGRLTIFSPATGFLKKTPPDKRMRIFLRDNEIYCDGSDPLQHSVRIKTDKQHFLQINDKTYRGFFWIYIVNGKLMVINHVELEQYLYGVLPREVSSSWPQQVLRAQAIAARTYALYHMIKRENELYDVFSTTSSQVYGGKDDEHRATQEAVDHTKGLILAFDNKIVLSLYHANSGGTTEHLEEVWGSCLPYLKAIDDAHSRNRPGFSWEKTLSAEEILGNLRELGLPAGVIKGIVPVERALTGRIKKLQIVQETESFYLSGNSFRLIVGPGKVKSTRFDVVKDRDRFVFSGRGYGHGVGMSQWGAYGMARDGYDYRQILRFYYPGTEIVYIKVL